MSTTDTVHGRIELARADLTGRELTLGLGVLAATTFALLLLGDPTAHDSLHNFRHSAGVICH